MPVGVSLESTKVVRVAEAGFEVVWGVGVTLPASKVVEGDEGGCVVVVVPVEFLESVGLGKSKEVSSEI